jgi:hypothetical protein
VLFAGSYLAVIAVAPYDAWEQLGASGVLLLNLVAWALIATAVALVLIRHDTRRASRPVAIRDGIGREEQAQSGSELVPF